MNDMTLTAEQQSFAEENHDVIKSFLQAKNLGYDEYYDVVIFAYLEAVRTYCENHELRGKYTFKIIAFRFMSCDLIDHYRIRNVQKRRADTVSLDSSVPYDDNAEIPMSEIIGTDYDLAADAETGFLWGEIRKRLSRNQFDMLCMRIAGYNDREIAGHYGVPVRVVKYTSSKIQDSLKGVCLI